MVAWVGTRTEDFKSASFAVERSGREVLWVRAVKEEISFVWRVGRSDILVGGRGGRWRR